MLEKKGTRTAVELLPHPWMLQVQGRLTARLKWDVGHIREGTLSAA